MKCCAVQVGFAPQMFERKVAQDIGAERGVVDFGMELHRPHLLFGILDRGDGVGRRGSQVKAGRQFFGFVAVRHPDGEHFGQARERVASPRLISNLGVAVLALLGGAHFAAERVAP